MAERALDAEMEAHLEREGEQDAGNLYEVHFRRAGGSVRGDIPRICVVRKDCWRGKWT